MVLAIVLANVQTALPAALGLSVARIDLVLCVCLWLGLRAGVAEGAALSLWCGYLTDLYAGGPPFLFSFLAVLMFVLARLVAAQLAGEGWFFAAVLGGGASALQGGLAFLLLWLFQGQAERGLAALWAIPATAGLTAIGAPACFFFLDVIEGLFARGEQGALR